MSKAATKDMSMERICSMHKTTTALAKDLVWPRGMQAGAQPTLGFLHLELPSMVVEDDARDEPLGVVTAFFFASASSLAILSFA